MCGSFRFSSLFVCSLYLTHKPTHRRHHPIDRYTRSVIDGLDVLDAMEKTPVGKKNRPVNDILLKSVTIHANPFADAAA